MVWNAWSEKAKSIADLGNDVHTNSHTGDGCFQGSIQLAQEWLKYACVEAAAVERPIQLAPEQVWVGKQRMMMHDA